MVYIKYGEKFSEFVFDDVVVLLSKGNSLGLYCKNGNESV